jgi:hypothetical protein
LKQDLSELLQLNLTSLSFMIVTEGATTLKSGGIPKIVLRSRWIGTLKQRSKYVQGDGRGPDSKSRFTEFDSLTARQIYDS